jgi:hypothetical protein
MADSDIIAGLHLVIPFISMGTSIPPNQKVNKGDEPKHLSVNFGPNGERNI